MKIIGIATKDAKLYFELVSTLRERNIVFEIIVPGESIPPNVGVIITSRSERNSIEFDNVVVYSGNTETTVLEAMKVLMGREVIYELVIGIDPGEHIGIAVVGDGVVLGTATVFSVHAMINVIKTYLKVFHAFKKIIRVGHGDITKRNKIISVLWKFHLPIEIVDERGTTMVTAQPDVEAAVRIAGHSGKDISEKPCVEPTDGEIRNIQRISRIKSNGELTISKEYAREVASGKITIEEAIKKQKKRRKKFLKLSSSF